MPKKYVKIKLIWKSYNHRKKNVPCLGENMQFLKLLFIFTLLSTSIFGEQKVVLISGATSGIGFATTKVFHDKGWKVWAGYRTHIPDELKQMENVRFCHLDVTKDNLVQSAIENILKDDGRIDALINNAGYGLIGPEECVTIEEAQHLFDVNFFGALRLIQAVLPTMRKQQSGYILNISSGAGIYSIPGLGLYSASKFALEGLSESLAATLSPWNIKVSVIELGFVKNNWGKNCVIGSRTCDEEFYKKLIQGICQMLSVPQGQPSKDIADLLVKIVETPQPNVRYQTSPNMNDWISKKLVDPTGLREYHDNLKFINRRIESR